jgi:hypothetical protein
VLRSLLDHLVVTAPSLEAGSEFVRQALGVEPQPGGEHARMGTHNRVLKLGDATYLEVLAINPAAPPPGHARWFGLDELEADAPPRLATWVVRSGDIGAALKASPVVSGYVTKMSRGDFHWQITVPRNGGLPLQGIAPTMIQWDDRHPAASMPASGCSLVRLEGFHPRAEAVMRMLEAIGFQGEFSVQAGSARLVAHVMTPSGPRQLPVT